MNKLILASSANQGTVLKSDPPAIYVDGARRRELQLLKWEILPSPSFGKAIISATGSYVTGPCGRLGDPNELPAIGANIRIREAGRSSGAEFLGSVINNTFLVDERGEHFVAECRHQLVDKLNGRITSLWQNENQSAVETNQTRIGFNTAQNTLASDSLITINARQCRIFDYGLNARRWSVADVLGYLLATTVPSDVEVPSLSELDALAGNLDLDGMDVTGKTVADAITEVAKVGGLKVRSARFGLGLIFYRPGREGRRRNVHLQPAGSQLSLAKSNLWQGRIHISRRPSQHNLLVLGERKRYESTFALMKGWDRTLETQRWRDFVRNKADNWPKVADVYRKWVLNEHGWYSGSPWSLSVHDFASISSVSFTARVTRMLLPCLSSDLQGQSLGVVVEIQCGVGAAWQRWRGPLWVSRDECAIYLGGNALPGEYFQATINDEVSVRVTGTVEADTRLTAEVTGDPNAPLDVVDISSRAAWRNVHSSSIFKLAEGVGTPAERDDSDLLNQLAARHAEVASTASEAELTLGWVDTSFHIGDIIERIDGRGFELASNPDTHPFIRSVRHEFGATHTTKLFVSG